MPGISLLYGDRSGLVGDASALFDAVQFLDRYEAQTELRTDELLLGHTGYPEYPRCRFETDEAVALLEGRLYGTEDVAGAVQEAVTLLADEEWAALADWLHRDGPFLLAVYRRSTGDVELLTDPFRRLPTYYTTVDGLTVVSRELKFVRAAIDRSDSPLALDRLGAAQQVALGYPLGNRTLFCGVRCLPPASVARFEGGGDHEIVQLSQFEFDADTVEDRSVEEHATELVSRFTTACRHRHTDDRRTVLSLSGGLDSRAVAGAFAHDELPCSAVTFDTSGGSTEADVWVAARVADALDIDWRCYSVDIPRLPAEHRERLLEMKQGLNYFGMTFIMEFFDRLHADLPGATYVTGDGGQMGLTDLKPPKQFSDEDALLAYVIEANAQLPLAEAASVTQVDTEEIRESIRARLRSYPETAYDAKYAHFILREQGCNYLMHGEDRNRYYFWSVSPFYSLPFFEYALRCPDEQKHGRELYAAFLDRMAPDVLAIEYADFDAPITSVEYRLKRALDTTLSKYPAMRRRVVTYLHDDPDRSRTAAERIGTRLAESDLRPLSEQAITAIATDHEDYRLSALKFLETLTAVASELSPPERPVKRPNP
jgi:asparagine synthase (glutamine-hydrolysing)